MYFHTPDGVHQMALPSHVNTATLKMCVAAQNRQKIHKNPIFASKVIDLDGNREPLYDLLLVINSNLGPMSLHY